MLWEKSMEDFVKRNTAVPLRLALWNGKVIELDDAPRVTLQITAPKALRYLLRPTLDTRYTRSWRSSRAQQFCR